MKRTERGWAGHFILGVILDKRGNRIGWGAIGACRWYETMIFVAHKDGIFIEADVTKQR